MNPLPAGYNGTYKPAEVKAYKISRSKIDLFLSCPRCFYLDRRLGVGRPSTPPFNINSAVDSLLKSEFDTHRAAGRKHPIQEEYGVDAEPAPHVQLEKWRENFHGVQAYHEVTNFLVFGAIDDLWVNSHGEYIVVDYKATAKSTPVTALGDAPWHDQYRRQIDFYQWLLRRNGLKVSPIAYWVYCTGNPNNKAFDRHVEFDVRLISYEGNDGWVEDALVNAHACLNSDEIPPSGEGCEYCTYASSRAQLESSTTLPPATSSQQKLF